MRLDDFDFPLPRELIADRPCEPREAARLLHIPAAGAFADRHIADLADLLRAGDLLVCNDTKVIPARLVGKRGAATVEVTLHRDEGGGMWRAFAKGARRLRPGDHLDFAADFAATVAAKHPEGDVTLRFDVEGAAFHEALARHGAMPLPPYIKRPSGGDPRDRADYQTMFASTEGAVAAPTAGLHFTPALIAALSRRGIGLATLTLHVGPGTFLPVKADDPRDHQMHAEWGVLSAETAARIAAARRAGGRIVALGTTSLRLLEISRRRNRRNPPFRRRDPALHPARLPFPRDRPALNQFPPAALDLVDAGRRPRRPRPDQSRLRPRHCPSLPLFLLWRRLPDRTCPR